MIDQWTQWTSSYTALVLPMTLFPSPFPEQLFNHAKRIQEALNELYFRVALDHEFLMKTLRVCHFTGYYFRWFQRMHILQFQKLDSGSILSFKAYAPPFLSVA